MLGVGPRIAQAWKHNVPSWPDPRYAFFHVDMQPPVSERAPNRAGHGRSRPRSAVPLADNSQSQAHVARTMKKPHRGELEVTPEMLRAVAWIRKRVGRIRAGWLHPQR